MCLCLTICLSLNQRCGLMPAPRARSPEIRNVRKFTTGNLRKIRDLQLRTKIAQSRASENLAEREGNSGLRVRLAVQRSAVEPRGYWGFGALSAEQRNFDRKQLAERESAELAYIRVSGCAALFQLRPMPFEHFVHYRPLPSLSDCPEPHFMVGQVVGQT